MRSTAPQPAACAAPRSDAREARTLFLELASAPRSRSSCAHSGWPCITAKSRGVAPLCARPHEAPRSATPSQRRAQRRPNDGPAHRGFAVHHGAALQQQLHHRRVAVLGSHVQRRLGVLCAAATCVSTAHRRCVCSGCVCSGRALCRTGSSGRVHSRLTPPSSAAVTAATSPPAAARSSAAAAAAAASASFSALLLPKQPIVAHGWYRERQRQRAERGRLAPGRLRAGTPRAGTHRWWAGLPMRAQQRRVRLRGARRRRRARSAVAQAQCRIALRAALALRATRLVAHRQAAAGERRGAVGAR